MDKYRTLVKGEIIKATDEALILGNWTPVQKASIGELWSDKWVPMRRRAVEEWHFPCRGTWEYPPSHHSAVWFVRNGGVCYCPKSIGDMTGWTAWKYAGSEIPALPEPPKTRAEVAYDEWSASKDSTGCSWKEAFLAGYKHGYEEGEIPW